VAWKYGLELVEAFGVCHTLSHWRVAVDGKPTAANVARHVAAYVESCRPGGVNAHVGRAFGVPYVVSARVVTCPGRVAVPGAEWVNPAPRPAFVAFWGGA
jgi:hypothetical protein